MARLNSTRPAPDEACPIGAAATAPKLVLRFCPVDTAKGVGVPHPQLLTIAQTLGRAMAREHVANGRRQPMCVEPTED